MSKYLAIPDHLKSLIEKRDWSDRRNKERRRKKKSTGTSSTAGDRRSGREQRGKARRKADIE